MGSSRNLRGRLQWNLAFSLRTFLRIGGCDGYAHLQSVLLRANLRIEPLALFAAAGVDKVINSLRKVVVLRCFVHEAQVGILALRYVATSTFTLHRLRCMHTALDTMRCYVTRCGKVTGKSCRSLNGDVGWVCEFRVAGVEPIDRQ